MPKEKTPIDELSEAITNSFENIKSISTSKVARNAIVVLVHDMIPAKYKVSKTAIAQVLESLEKLPDVYLKK